MNRKLVRISKFLSLVLRHNPKSIDISLDHGGWTRVDELLGKANQVGVHLDATLLQQIVAQNDKQRFALSEDGLRIRANQGHSIPVDLGLEPLAPPEFLYHGTAIRHLPSIEKQGILPRNRNHVHLSPDRRTAINVGQRHGKPIVLSVQTGRMHRRGFEFYRSVNGVWLTDSVPVAYLTFPEHE